MKNLLLFTLLTAIGHSSIAQTPFVTVDSIDANRINAAVLVHGDMWWDPQTGNARCFFPNGTRKSFNFAGSLWMSAYDNSGGLHVAAQTYRQDGNDYWPGPLDASGSLNYATSEKWAKIWKVHRSEIEAFKAIPFKNITNVPQAVLTWPAKGNAYAKGRDDAPLTIAEEMAPFIDMNGDGIYQPLKGDHPDIKSSEQALWWCFSDNGPTHDQTNATPMKVQVNAMSYAYKRNTLIDQVVYYDYTVINKSTNNYHDMRIAQWNDAALGYYMDDMLGFDSVWRMGIVYNWNHDDGGTAGYPSNSYGNYVPGYAVTMVVLPGDSDGDHRPVGSFMYYNNDPSIIGTPTIDTQYDHYMRSRLRNGWHLKYNADSPWVANSGTDRNYVFPDDPKEPMGWHGCSAWSSGGSNWKFVLSSNSFTLNAGARTKIVMAQLIDTFFGGCPSNSGYDTLRQIADTAWRNYHASQVNVPYIATTEKHLKIYPNPATDRLYVDLQDNKEISLYLYNSLGQKVHEERSSRATNIIDIRHLPPGIYTAICRDDGQMSRAVFIKQ